jgi:hypothetical protein
MRLYHLKTSYQALWRDLSGGKRYEFVLIDTVTMSSN